MPGPTLLGVTFKAIFKQFYEMRSYVMDAFRLLCHVYMGGKDAAPQDRERRSQDQRASMHWPQHAAYPDVVLTARTGLLASLLMW